MLDLQELEDHAKALFLHRFVEAVQAARKEFGRYLTLRAGDELAIQAADDGSAELFEGLKREGELPSAPIPPKRRRGDAPEGSS